MRSSGLVIIFQAALAVSSMLFVSGHAQAFFDAEFVMGKTTADWDGVSGSDAFAGTMYSAAAHLDPIPLVPVAFGLRAKSGTFQEKSSVKISNPMGLAPEVVAWLPLGDLSPFVRAAYYVYSPYTESTPMTSGSQSYTAKVTWRGRGPGLAAGVKYSVLPLIQIMAGYEQSQESLEYHEASYSDATARSADIKSMAKDFTLRSRTIFVGVSAGI